MYRLARTLLFRLDAEHAHEFVAHQIERVQRIPLALGVVERFCGVEHPVDFLGIRFRNPIGIAAGFDKNATMMPMLAALGFGFVEVGTVTLRPQPGNPRPRLFRLSEQHALINRMGFNNDGADAVARRLAAWERTVPLFVNIGKNKEVPLDAAPDAYARCAEKLAPYADVLTINVSSPNTPSLRDLQRPEHLSAILDAVDAPRVLVKIAPDLDDVLLGEIDEQPVHRAHGQLQLLRDCPYAKSARSGQQIKNLDNAHNARHRFASCRT